MNDALHPAEQASWTTAHDLQAPEPATRTAGLPGEGLVCSTLPADSPNEFRALWVTRWDFSTPDDIRRIADQAAKAHFNVLFFQVRGNADAYYRSRLEPWAARLSGALGQDPGWDPLYVAIDEAHQRGLELHTWLNVYPAWLGETPPTPATPEAMVQRFNRLYGDSWLVWDRNQKPMQLNKEYLWANPAHWAVVEHIVAVAHDILTRYYVDGIHLDNVRYPGWEYSTDPVTHDRVAQAAALESGLTRKEWQRRQVSSLVARFHRTIDLTKPGLMLSAAVWPVYQDTWEWWNAGDGYDGFCQDSLGWLSADIVEAICPMFYLGSITSDDGQFAALVGDFAARAQGRPVVTGITCTYDEFAPIGRRIDLARAAGVDGQALFAYSHINRHGYWDELRGGPYATPASVLPPRAARERVCNRLRSGSPVGLSASGQNAWWAAL